MAKKNRLEGKFVVGFDTMCDGNQCTMTEDAKGKRTPALFDSYDEAFKEIFDDAHSSLSNNSTKELREEFGITKKVFNEMGKILKTGNVRAMEAFLDKHPDLNTNNEFVEKADEFIMNRKAIYTGTGVVITGKKLK